MDSNNQGQDEEFAEEYRTIRKDLRSVIITNTILLALLVALYFINQSTGLLNSLENII